jgi:hypothetical protein
MHLPHAAIQKAETPVRPERLEGKSGADKALWRRVCRPAARFVSSDRTPSSVIPAKAGIQNRWLRAGCPWIPAFAGMTRATRSCLSAATDSIPPFDGEGQRRQRRRRGGVRHCGTASPLARESPPPQRRAPRCATASLLERDGATPDLPTRGRYAASVMAASDQAVPVGSLSRKPNSVIPATAGIQGGWLCVHCPWIPAFAGMTSGPHNHRLPKLAYHVPTSSF